MVLGKLIGAPMKCLFTGFRRPDSTLAKVTGYEDNLFLKKLLYSETSINDPSEK